jgi:hypothetical protein
MGAPYMPRGPSRVAGAGAILFLPRPPVASLAARSNWKRAMAGLLGVEAF